MVKIYTSQYRYSGRGRLDITSKGSKYFGPPWDLVNKFKKGFITEEIYSAYYYAHMLESYHLYPKVWNNILNLDVSVFVCFCPSGEFCHRTLLAKYFVDLGATYEGEIDVNVII